MASTKTKNDYTDSAFWVRKMKTYFEAMDIIKDNGLTKTDYDCVANRLFRTIRGRDQEAEIHEVYQKMFEIVVAGGDFVGGDTKIGVDDFIVNAARFLAENESAADFMKQKHNLFFDFADTDGNGTISGKEYKQYLVAYFGKNGEKMSEECFESIDRDGDQKITRKEFVDAHLHYWFETEANEALNPLPYGPLM